MVVVAALASLVKLGSSCRALSLRGLSLGWWASWWFVGWSFVLVVVGVGVLVWSVLVLVFGACVCVSGSPLCFITVGIPLNTMPLGFHRCVCEVPV